MIETIRQGLLQDGFDVSISKICQWFAVPRRTVYYKPVKSAPKMQARFAEPIKAMIEENPSFGYRTVAHPLDFNKNTVQRVFQLMGWQADQLSAADSSLALSGATSERALGHGLVPCLDRTRWLGRVGAGDRLPYP